MKQIINRKIYDTKTATHIGGYCNNLREGDFRYIDEDLYLKKTGEFFLAGEGGAMTKYSEKVGTSYTNGYGINPLTEEEAMDWVEKYLDTDTYIELFGEPEE
jgi:hypothetical protein